MLHPCFLGVWERQSSLDLGYVGPHPIPLFMNRLPRINNNRPNQTCASIGICEIHLYASLNVRHLLVFIPLWTLVSGTVVCPPLLTLLDESLTGRYGPRPKHRTTCPLRAAQPIRCKVCFWVPPKLPSHVAVHIYFLSLEDACNTPPFLIYIS